MSRENPARPGGTLPPAQASFNGAAVDLVPLATDIATRHLARHPEDAEVYGPELAREWAVHDMQWVLVWAFGDAAGLIDLEQQIRWLAGVLDSREYPLENFWDGLEEAANVVREGVPGGAPVAARLDEIRSAAR